MKGAVLLGPDEGMVFDTAGAEYVKVGRPAFARDIPARVYRWRAVVIGSRVLEGWVFERETTV